MRSHLLACAEEVKAAAKVCRYCGYNFEREAQRSERAQKLEAAKTRARARWPWLVAGAAVLIAAGIGLWAFYQGQPDTYESARELIAELETGGICELDPDSPQVEDEERSSAWCRVRGSGDLYGVQVFKSGELPGSLENWVPPEEVPGGRRVALWGPNWQVIVIAEGTALLEPAQEVIGGDILQVRQD